MDTVGIIHKRIVVPGVLSSLETVHRWAHSTLAELRLPEEAHHNILLAISEAVTNAIRHGSRERMEQAVVVSLQGSSSEVAVSVDDNGEGFDPSTIPDPTHEKHIYRTGGRGVYLLKALADDLKVLRTETGTRVHFNFVLE